MHNRGVVEADNVRTATEGDLQLRLQDFVRRFGLLRTDQTPCGCPLATSHAHALQLLGAAGTLTQQELARRLRLDKSTTSRLVAKLAERGWVEKRSNPDDRRASRLTLSVTGQTVLADLSRAAAAKYRALWGRIPPAERPRVLAALHTLTQALEEDASSR